MWLCYGIQQSDKTSIGTQATFGLSKVLLEFHKLRYLTSSSTNTDLGYRTGWTAILMAHDDILYHIHVLRVSVQRHPAAVSNGPNIIMLYDLLGCRSSMYRIYAELHTAGHPTCVAGYVRGKFYFLELKAWEHRSTYKALPLSSVVSRLASFSSLEAGIRHANMRRGRSSSRAPMLVSELLPT